MSLREKIGPLLKHPRNSIRVFFSEERRAVAPVSEWGAHAFGQDDELLRFQRYFGENLKNCTWNPHRQYSVFTQYDQDFYLKRKRHFSISTNPFMRSRKL